MEYHKLESDWMTSKSSEMGGENVESNQKETE